MKCPKCNGEGWRYNPKYSGYNAASLYSNGEDVRKPCSKCRGTGFIIGSIREVYDTLIVLRNNHKWHKEELRDINQCIEAIEK